MSDIALDADGDALFDDSGNLVLATGDDAIRQQMMIRFRFALGEWFLDTRQGVPYFSEILIKNPNLTRVRGIFRQLILTTPGIESIESFSLGLDSAVRKLVLRFSARKSDGEILEFDDAFIIK